MAERTLPSPVDAPPEVAKQVNSSAFLILLAVLAAVGIFVWLVGTRAQPPNALSESTANELSIDPIGIEALPAE